MGIAVVIVMGLMALLLGLLFGTHQESKFNVDGIGKVCKTSRNSARASKLIGEFLKARRWVCRLDVCRTRPYVDSDGVTKQDYLPAVGSGWWVFIGTNREICNYIRLCHFLGCEVILRQEGEKDDAESEGVEQVVTFMSPEYKREGMDFSYQYNKGV